MNNDKHKYGTLIARLMAERSTPEEEKELERWMLESEENMKLFEALINEDKTRWAKKWFAEAGVNTRHIRWKDQGGWYRTDTDTTAGFYVVIALILVGMSFVYWVLNNV